MKGLLPVDFYRVGFTKRAGAQAENKYNSEIPKMTLYINSG